MLKRIWRAVEMLIFTATPKKLVNQATFFVYRAFYMPTRRINQLPRVCFHGGSPIPFAHIVTKEKVVEEALCFRSKAGGITLACAGTQQGRWTRLDQCYLLEQIEDAVLPPEDSGFSPGNSVAVVDKTQWPNNELD